MNDPHDPVDELLDALRDHAPVPLATLVALGDGRWEAAWYASREPQQLVPLAALLAPDATDQACLATLDRLLGTAPLFPHLLRSIASGKVTTELMTARELCVLKLPGCGLACRAAGAPRDAAACAALEALASDDDRAVEARLGTAAAALTVVQWIVDDGPRYGGWTRAVWLASALDHASDHAACAAAPGQRHAAARAAAAATCVALRAAVPRPSLAQLVELAARRVRDLAAAPP